MFAKMRWLLAILLCCIVAIGAWRTPLDKYVAAPDSSYTYRVIARYPALSAGQASLYVLNMTSQTWKNERWSNHPVWWHYMTVAIPPNVRHDKVLLWIGGGSNTQGPPTMTGDPLLLATRLWAETNSAVAVYLKNIPNQPIRFKGDKKKENRYEDDLIAFTWKQFLENTRDPYVLARMPMTKAVVRAMDTVTDFCKKERPLAPTQNKFILTGESKRGWTTWLAGAVDRRVVAIIPQTLTILNLIESNHKHFQSYGGWSYAYNSYHRENLTEYLYEKHRGHANYKRLASIVDPYAYRNRLTMPKLIVAASGDEFFMPDDTHLFFHNLPGPKYYWLIPNVPHNLGGEYVSRFFNFGAFYQLIAQNDWNHPMPVVTWERHTTDNVGTLIVKSTPPPLRVTGLRAKTSEMVSPRRDFRLRVMGKDGRMPTNTSFTEVVVPHMRGVGGFTWTEEAPKSGYLAFFAELVFAAPFGAEFTVTSEIIVLPTKMPFGKCSSQEECTGNLV